MTMMTTTTTIMIIDRVMPCVFFTVLVTKSKMKA
jgi:hypothetical protein